MITESIRDFNPTDTFYKKDSVVNYNNVPLDSFFTEANNIDIDAFAQSHNIAPSISENNLTNGKYIEILDKNLEFYTKLKEQCLQYFSTIKATIMEYNAKINTAKTQEKKRYYNKKRTKIQENLVELLSRMDALDSAIKRAQEKKAELLES